MVSLRSADPASGASGIFDDPFVTGAAVFIGLLGSFVIGILSGMRSRGQKTYVHHIAISALTGLAGLINGRERSWRADEWMADLEQSATPIRYAAGVVGAALRMRLSDLAQLGVRPMCWVLASDLRTWGMLGPVMAIAIANVHAEQGWGSAFFTLPGVVAFYAGVEWLRHRWGIEVKRGRRPEGE